MAGSSGDLKLAQTWQRCLGLHLEQVIFRTPLIILCFEAAGDSCFDCQQWTEICICFQNVLTSPEAHTPSCSKVTGVLSLGIRWPRRETNLTPLSDAKFKNNCPFIIDWKLQFCVQSVLFCISLYQKVVIGRFTSMCTRTYGLVVHIVRVPDCRTVTLHDRVING